MGLSSPLQAQITLFVVLLTIFLSSTAITLASNFPIAKPGCQDTCGNFTIPYPFGTTENCYLSKDFNLTCNTTTNTLLMGNLPVTKISLEGQLWFNKLISYICYRRNGEIQSKIQGSFTLPRRSFNFNSSANVYMVVGCNSYAYFRGIRLRDYTVSTGCISVCTSEQEISNDGICSGAGCCQANVPAGISDLNTSVYSLGNYSYIEGINNCIYASIVEERSFNFSKERITKGWNSNRLPAVLDWAIVNNDNCDAAEASPDYACKGNSSCFNNENPKGYRCHCNPGYEGNPYLDSPGGCIDIDECKVNNPCKKNSKCQNTNGNYTCNCNEGYTGDGFLDDCKRDDKFFYQLVVGISVASFFILLASTWLYFILKKRKSIQRKEMMREKFFKENGGLLLTEKFSKQQGEVRAKIYFEHELENATDNFAESRILGQGGYGIVFKGYLKGISDIGQHEIAVKKSKQMDRSQMETFANEVFLLSQINHINVVRLLGCCLDTESPLLVYEFVENGTLLEHIHDNVKASFLSLEIRLRIATETAEVLSYLHTAASPPIIHRDIKSANILLDKNYTAKVSDFGVSRLFPLDETQLPTVVLGTFGYLDPEYMQTGKLTVKSDVYSFGMLLMEIVTGKKVVYFDAKGEERRLARDFISCLDENRLHEILDVNLRVKDGDYYDLLIQVALVAKRCISIRGEDRPSMREVATKLRGLLYEMKPKDFQAKPAETGKLEPLLLEASMEDGFDGISISIGGSGGMGNYRQLGTADGR